MWKSGEESEEKKERRIREIERDKKRLATTNEYEEEEVRV